MNREMDHMRLSELVDGELSSDEANEVLLAVLDDADSRERLKSLLQMRIALASWRRRTPTRPILAVRTRDHKAAPSAAWRFGSLAAAAVIGGVLVMGGFLIAQRGDDRQQGDVSAVSLPPYGVTADQQREVARVFALHESVAGPLAWYAADEDKIHLAAASLDVARGRPVAMILHLAPVSDAPGRLKRYVIVCRENEPMRIDLPAVSADGEPIRVHLVARPLDGSVDLRYAFAVVSGADGGERAAGLLGRRSVGIAGARLGQMAMGERLLDFSASAWPLEDGRLE